MRALLQKWCLFPILFQLFRRKVSKTLADVDFLHFKCADVGLLINKASSATTFCLRDPSQSFNPEKLVVKHEGFLRCCCVVSQQMTNHHFFSVEYYLQLPKFFLANRFTFKNFMENTKFASLQVLLGETTFDKHEGFVACCCVSSQMKNHHYFSTADYLQLP